MVRLENGKPLRSTHSGILKRSGKSRTTRSEQHSCDRMRMRLIYQVGQVGILVVASEQHDHVLSGERSQSLDRRVDVRGFRVVEACHSRN